MVNPFAITLENQADDEKILRVWRHHWFTIIGPVARTMAFAIVPIGILIYNIATGFPMFGNVFLFILWLVILAITITYAAYEWVSWWSDVFVLTNYRVIDVQQHGFFDRKYSEANLSNIQDVSQEISGVFPTMLNYGDVLVQTAGANVKISITDVGNPQEQAVYILKQQQIHIADQDDSLSAEDLIRLLAKHRKDLDNLAKEEKDEKLKDIDEQVKKAKKEKAKRRVKTDKKEHIE